MPIQYLQVIACYAHLHGLDSVTAFTEEIVDEDHQERPIAADLSETRLQIDRGQVCAVFRLSRRNGSDVRHASVDDARLHQQTRSGRAVPDPSVYTFRLLPRSRWASPLTLEEPRA